VLHIEVGDPLERLVAGLYVAVALAAHLESKHVEAGRQQLFTVRLARPAVGAELETEENHAAALGGRRPQVAAAQLQVVRSRDANVFGAFDRLAAWDDEQRLL